MLGQKFCCTSKVFLPFSSISSLPHSPFLRDFGLLFFGDCIFLCSLFFPHYVSLSALFSSVLFFDCLLPSLIAAFPPLCHLQLISTNNDCNLALVQSYKLIMHTSINHTLKRFLRCRKWLTLVCVHVDVWVGCVGDDSWMHSNSHLSAWGKTMAS